MSGVQTHNGKAFEYACLKALKELLGRGYTQLDVTATATAEECFKGTAPHMQEIMLKAARAGIAKIYDFEPRLNSASPGHPVCCDIQADKRGEAGDVRDIICRGIGDSWEIGISCKHNSFAVKHSRLSASIDFGDKWLGHPCSSRYMERVREIFERAEHYKSQGVTWKSLGTDKTSEFYLPTLEAFKEEIEDIANRSEGVPRAFVMYMLGNRDFYKLISVDNQCLSKITPYNLNGTLGKTFGGVMPRQKLKRLKTPTKFSDIFFEEGKNDTLKIICDAGWAFSLRIHNASTVVEPSLKFDVQLDGNPSSMENFNSSWR